MLSHQRMGDSLLVVVVNTHDDERAAALPLLCGATSLTYTAPPYSPAAGSTWLLCRRRIDGQESATGQFCFCVISILLSSNGFALPPPLLTHNACPFNTCRPQADWSPALYAFFETLDFINLDISGLSVGAMSCFGTRSAPVTGLILLKIVVAISLPWIVIMCIIVHRNHKLKRAKQYEQQYREMLGPGGRCESDLQQVNTDSGESQGGVAAAPNDRKVLDTMIALLNDNEHPQDFRAVLSKSEATITLRLFATYDADGSEECDTEELRLFVDDFGLNIDDEQLTRLIEAVLVYDAVRHDVAPKTAAELVKYTMQSANKSNRKKKKSSFSTSESLPGGEEQDDPTAALLDDAGGVHLRSEDFLVLVGAYHQARVSEMSEEEALAYELYPKGSSAWLHDYRLRATGKMWKNIVLTQYMLVPPTVRLCASVFVCDPLTPSGAPDPAMSVHLSRADYTYMCDTTEYMLVRWVGWLGAFFYAFVVPMFWVISLYRRRNLLSSFSNFQQFGFLYVCYKRDSWIAYQWDVVETWRKLALGTLIIFVTPGSMTQLGCFFVVCLVR